MMAGLSDLAGKTALITGGASGIGRALAECFVAQGMNVVIADIEDNRLQAAAREIGAFGVRTDVSSLESVEALAQASCERFGTVHVVCNNAGIGPFARVADLTMADWQWMLNVNLWGVIHGVHVFLPILKANADGGWIVNTASMGGVSTFPGLGAYATTKFGVTALTETLAMELREEESLVGVSLLLPGPIHSNLGTSSRNRPAGLASGHLVDLDLAELPEYAEVLPWREPSHAAAVTLAAIRDGLLYAVTHPEQFGRVEGRVTGLLAAFGRSAVFGDAEDGTQ